MLKQKIHQAMRELGKGPLASTTRMALWQIRDQALARQREIESTRFMPVSIGLITQTRFWSTSGLFAGLLLLGAILTWQLPVATQASVSSPVTCTVCQLNELCRL